MIIKIKMIIKINLEVLIIDRIIIKLLMIDKITIEILMTEIIIIIISKEDKIKIEILKIRIIITIINHLIEIKIIKEHLIMEIIMIEIKDHIMIGIKYINILGNSKNIKKGIIMIMDSIEIIIIIINSLLEDQIEINFKEEMKEL